MGLFRSRTAAVLPPVSAQFVSLNVGGTLVLKALGFIEAQQALIRDVTETSLRMRLSPPGESALKVDLHFEPVAVPEGVASRAHATSVNVTVSIRPLSRRWTAERYDEVTRQLLWKLRSHFVAC